MIPHGRVTPSAFITWAHASGEDDGLRKNLVLDFTLLMRRLGVDCDIDLFHVHDSHTDWTRYGAKSIDDNDYVLIIVSKEWSARWEGTNPPTEGAGAAAEADALKSIFQRDQELFRRKVKLVLLPGATDDRIPNGLHGVRRFRIPTLEEASVEDLLRTLTNQPKYVVPPLGQIPVLPPATVKAAQLHTDLSPEARYDELKPLAEQIRLLERALQQLPMPEITEGPHLPWHREWHRLRDNIIKLGHEYMRVEQAARRPESPQGAPKPGVVFELHHFKSSNSAASGLEEFGYWDFSAGGFRQWTEGHIKHVEILKTAQTNGDVGIAHHVEVRPGEEYRLTASLRIRNKTGSFKGRLNLASRKESGVQLQEWNAPLSRTSDSATTLTVDGTMPPGTALLSARVKFHTSKPGESGVGEIHSMKLERIK